MPGVYYALEPGGVQRPVRFDGMVDRGALRPVYEPPPAYPTGTRLAREWPYLASDAGNVSIGSGATFESAGATQTAQFLALTPYVNRENWSVAVYQADIESPFVTVLHPSTSAPMGSMFIPPGTEPTGGTDLHVAVIQPDGRSVYELYQLVRISDTSYTSPYVQLNDMHGSGLLRGTRASGTSILMGLIRQRDITAGDIPHTLTLSAPSEALLSGWVWPARSEDAHPPTYTGTIPMGSMFAIPSTTDITTLGLSTVGLMLAKALQDFGGHIMINGENAALYAEFSVSSSVTSQMRTQWALIFPHMRRVTNNTSVNIAGGGTRRRADAPAIYSPMFGTPMTPQ